MAESDDDSGLSSCSHDVFGINYDIEPYEDLLLREGLPSMQLLSIMTWKYDAFTEKGSQFIGGLKKNIARYNQMSTLAYNKIDAILFEKSGIELNRSMNIIKEDFKERGGSPTITLFTAFASVCPEEFLFYLEVG